MGDFPFIDYPFILWDFNSERDWEAIKSNPQIEIEKSKPSLTPTLMGSN